MGCPFADQGDKTYGCFVICKVTSILHTFGDAQHHQKCARSIIFRCKQTASFSSFKGKSYKKKRTHNISPQIQPHFSFISATSVILGEKVDPTERSQAE